VRRRGSGRILSSISEVPIRCTLDLRVRSADEYAQTRTNTSAGARAYDERESTTAAVAEVECKMSRTRARAFLCSRWGWPTHRWGLSEGGGQPLCTRYQKKKLQFKNIFHRLLLLMILLLLLLVPIIIIIILLLLIIITIIQLLRTTVTVTGGVLVADGRWPMPSENHLPW